MVRFLISIIITGSVFAGGINAESEQFSQEGGFQSIPSNISSCVGACQKEIYPYAVLSNDAYLNTHNDNDLPDNWSYAFTDNFGSYAGSVYLNATEKKIVYAFRGTDGPVDMFNDLLQAVGILPVPYAYAAATLYNHIKILKQESDTFKDWELILTGHSLGGGLAQFVANIFSLKAYTFNTAPISSKVENLAKVNSFLAPFLLDYENVVGIGNTDILNIVSYNTSGSYFDVVSWSPGELYGTSKSLEIDDAKGLISTHSITTIISQLEQNLFTLPDDDPAEDPTEPGMPTATVCPESVDVNDGVFQPNITTRKLETFSDNSQPEQGDYEANCVYEGAAGITFWFRPSGLGLQPAGACGESQAHVQIGAQLASSIRTIGVQAFASGGQAFVNYWDDLEKTLTAAESQGLGGLCP